MVRLHRARDNETIVYIGKSNNVLFRIAEHKKENVKTFTHHSHIEIKCETNMNDIENFLIQLYTPVYNRQKHIPKDLTETADILNLTEDDIYTLLFSIEEFALVYN